MSSKLRYMFVPSKYEDEVIQNAIATFEKATTRIEQIRAEYSRDVRIVHCKQHYYVLSPDIFDSLYDKEKTKGGMYNERISLHCFAGKA